MQGLVALIKKFLMKILWEASGIFVLVSALVQDLIKVFPCVQHLWKDVGMSRRRS